MLQNYRQFEEFERTVRSLLFNDNFRFRLKYCAASRSYCGLYLNDYDAFVYISNDILGLLPYFDLILQLNRMN
jgi:hypothetical protein